MHRNKVDFKLAVWVCQNAASVFCQPSVATRVRAEVETRLVIVVGVQVIPDGHFTFDDTADFVHSFNSNLLRHDFLT